MLQHGNRTYNLHTSSSNGQAQRQVLAKASEQTPSARRNITDRIEQLRRQNDSLKQAIGLFLDQPQDVGAITGKPTGTWDKGSTASLLDSLSRKRSTVDQDSEEAVLDSDEAANLVNDGDPASAPNQEQIYEQAELPAGPVYDTDLAGPAWMDAASYPDESRFSSSKDSQRSSNSSQPAVGRKNTPSIAAAPPAAADSDAAPAAPHTPATADSGTVPAAVSSPAAADSGAAPAAPSTSATEPADGSWPSPSFAAATVVGALAALQADIVKAVNGTSNGTSNGTATATAVPAALVDAPPKPSVLGRIHERLEEMEREHKQQQKAASKQQKLAVKPRAKGAWKMQSQLLLSARLSLLRRSAVRAGSAPMYSRMCDIITFC